MKRSILRAAAIGAVILGSGPSAADDCSLSEQQIRDFWVVARGRGKDEIEGIRIVADLVRAAEGLCRSAKVVPMPLPPELQRMVR